MVQTSLRLHVWALAMLLVVGLLAAGVTRAAGLPAGNRGEVSELPASTERLFLSGTGFRNTVDWEFRVSAGRRAGEWTTIPVPSQWEQQGFGSYNYGHDEQKSDEEGFYRFRFEVPEGWLERTVEIVFEGVMTDTEVRINGTLAGPIHQGGFYRFRYPVGRLLQPGENLLEVKVAKVSANSSVEKAERDADYWVFGGIYRPVYLESFPRENIAWLGVDARHDGRLSARIETRGLDAEALIGLAIEHLDGSLLGGVDETVVQPGAQTVTLVGQVSGIQPWSAEDPVLYRLVVELSRGGHLLHRVEHRIGFRTFEVRPGEGLFVNGRRTLLKGVNRHAFWPASGRALDRALDRQDVERIKALNMNAVRSSHYPPDVSFLELCDELGLYVFDELTGWHDAYDGAVGRRLVEEMVRRDVNHPSILFWNNGNEDGWNSDLDPLFAELDPQRRPVLHPDELLSGVDTRHYLTWSELQQRVAPSELRLRWLGWIGGDQQALVLPTEVLHGLYDGGSGAALEDYWNAIRRSPRGAGAVLWSYSDESVVRTDRGGALDNDGNHAPDGILGPWRESSGNEWAVREVFSPVWIAPGRGIGADGTVWVENRFDATSLDRCTFEWSLLRFPGPGVADPEIEVSEGENISGPPLEPGQAGPLFLALPEDWRLWDALRLTAHDPRGRALLTWVLPISDPWRKNRWGAASLGRTKGWIEGEQVVLQGGGTTARIDRGTGTLTSLALGGEDTLLSGGPRRADPGLPGPRVRALELREEGGSQIVEVLYDRGLQHVRWVLLPSGWLRLSFQYQLRDSAPYHGLAFDLDEEAVSGLTWLGEGPARVWANRRVGGTLGLWQKQRDGGTPPESGAEPKLRGYYQALIWARLDTSGGSVGLAFEDPQTFLGVLPPRFPDDSKEAVARVPETGLAILRGLPAIGTKFYGPQELGPQSQLHAPGLYRGSFWFFPWVDSGSAAPRE